MVTETITHVFICENQTEYDDCVADITNVLSGREGYAQENDAANLTVTVTQPVREY